MQAYSIKNANKRHMTSKMMLKAWIFSSKSVADDEHTVDFQKTLLNRLTDIIAVGSHRIYNGAPASIVARYHNLIRECDKNWERYISRLDAIGYDAEFRFGTLALRQNVYTLLKMQEPQYIKPFFGHIGWSLEEIEESLADAEAGDVPFDYLETRGVKA